MAKNVDVGDRLTTISDHRRAVDQDPAAVVNRGERALRHRLGQLGREPNTIGQDTEPDAAGMGHHAGPATSYRQAG